jgi:hypothetical protein
VAFNAKMTSKAFRSEPGLALFDKMRCENDSTQILAKAAVAASSLAP